MALLLGAGPIVVLTRLLGPLPQLLILVGNAITPGRGFREGPFASEAELRELVDLAEAAGHRDERAEMIHSVFELGDTMVREVMVPRTGHRVHRTRQDVRQALNLALRSGFSRIPVIGESPDDVLGVVYLKDVTKRVFDKREAETTSVETCMRPAKFVPDSKPVDELLREMQAERDAHGDRRRRVRRHGGPRDDRGHPRGDRRRDRRRVRQGRRSAVEHLANGPCG